MVPSLCANGCGFYGSASNKNLCSKCYKDYLKENINKSNAYVTKNLNGQVVDSRKASASEGSITDLDGMNTKRKRCQRCNKKVGLLGFECRCGNVFCGRHRHPEEHACNVDLKEIGCRTLVKQNPLCIGDKLEKRI